MSCIGLSNPILIKPWQVQRFMSCFGLRSNRIFGLRSVVNSRGGPGEDFNPKVSKYLLWEEDFLYYTYQCCWSENSHGIIVPFLTLPTSSPPTVSEITHGKTSFWSQRFGPKKNRKGRGLQRNIDTKRKVRNNLSKSFFAFSL